MNFRYISYKSFDGVLGHFLSDESPNDLSVFGEKDFKVAAEDGD